MDGLCLKTGIHGIPPVTSIGGTQEARCCAPHVTSHGKSTVAALSQKSASSRTSRFSIRYSLKSLWPGGAENDKRCDKLALNDGVLVESKEARRADAHEETEIGCATSPSSLQGQSRNWIPKILRIKSLRSCETVAEEETVEKARNVSGEAHCVNDNSGDECDVCLVAEENTEQIELDRESFSRMLRKVSLAEAKLYAQISHLGNLAYSIPKIKAGNLLKFHGLRFVTSSLEKREVASKAKNNHTTVENQSAERDTNNKGVHEEPQSSGYERSASAAYQIATFATSYLHSHTKDLLPFKSSKAGYDVGSDCTGSKDRVEETTNSDVASHTANKDGVTSVVAAAEEVRQTVADDLNSILSSPCEWFSCDDDQSSTRFFIIQGSESLASWQANLLFEPTQFEGLDVHVHRGIYEAAKGIYRQLLPEVRAHLRACGNHGHFRFSGHSLGGSLSLLISLMLLIRGEVPASCLLPIITFGSPSIMCGGDRLLHKLGLPRSHVQAIMMHRDIVPRAFSCHFPSHVYELLKAVNGNFRNHPCLNNQKLLYSPIGELLILQPDEKFSPEHHLLPCGSGLYVLSCPLSPTQNTEKQLQAAQMLFLNSPHPIEILSERSAYGSEGSIQRYHDMNSYLRCVRGVMRGEQNRIRKERRERTRKMWQYLVLLAGINASMVLGRSVASFSMGQQELHFSSILQAGKEKLGSFSGLVASQCMHMLVLMLYHVKLLVSGIRSVISFN